MKPLDLAFLLGLTLAGLGAYKEVGAEVQKNSVSCSCSGLENKVNQPAGARTTQPAQTQSAKPQLNLNAYQIARLTELENKYGFLSVYDSSVEKNVKELQTRIKLPDLEKNLVKAMIFEETGSVRYRDNAFKYDPMQIANQGDFGLDVLANGKENSYLIEDLSCLKGKTKTPRRNGKWDYSQTNMTGEDSINGGVSFLAHKKAIYGTRTEEQGQQYNYIIKSGDNLSKIAKRNGTTVGTIKKYNPNIVPEELSAGKTIILRKAKSAQYISGWRTNDEAVARYNGGGNPNYLNEVNKIKSELDELDRLKYSNQLRQADKQDVTKTLSAGNKK